MDDDLRTPSVTEPVRPSAEAAVESRRSVWRGKVVDLWVEHVRLPGGAEAELEIVRHVGAAAVVPVTGAGEVILVRQFRHAAGGWLLEIPAGKLDAGESPEACARRETAEEVGLRPGRLEPLGWIFTTPGFTDERIWLYLASDLTPAEQALDDDEVIEVVRLPLDDAVAMARSGELVDAKTAVALLRAAATLG